jgi:hypothetical protein
VIFEPGKNISWHILHQHWYTCPITLPVHRNPSIHVYWLLSPTLPHLAGRHLRLLNILERMSLYVTHTSHRKHDAFLYEYPLHWALLPTKKNTKKTLLFDSTLLKHGHHFDYWNQPLIMHMHVCYLDCHEAQLCCYLHYSCFTSICDLFTDSPSY